MLRTSTVFPRCWPVSLFLVPEAKIYLLLCSAVWEGHTSCVKFLLEKVSRKTTETEDPDTKQFVTREQPKMGRLLTDPPMWRPRKKLKSKPCLQTNGIQIF